MGKAAEGVSEVANNAKENLQVSGKSTLAPSKPNLWSGKGFSADSMLAQASAHDPTAIGAGTLFGGKKGGGLGGVLGATLRSVGAGISGGDPTMMTESSLYARDPKVDTDEKTPTTASISDSEAAPEAIDEGYQVQSQEKYKNSFQQNFTQARDAQAKTFKWMAEDGVEREYNTRMENETTEEWNNFLQNTTQDQTSSKMLVEDDALEQSYETDVTYAHNNIDSIIADDIENTTSSNAFKRDSGAMTPEEYQAKYGPPEEEQEAPSGAPPVKRQIDAPQSVFSYGPKYGRNRNNVY